MADAAGSTVLSVPVPVPLAASTLAALSTEELMEAATETAHRVGALLGRFVELVGELDRRQGWRDEGATSLEGWIVERCGVSVPTARAWSHVAGRLFDLPQLAGALCAGEISFDKVRAVVDVATPETDHALVETAVDCSVRQLAELARSTRGTGAERARSDEGRRSLRFNDTFRTLSVQLPPESYAEAKRALEVRARRMPSDGETPWDQRLCDGFMELLRSGGTGGPSRPSPFFVVAHVPLEALVEGDSTLSGELEEGGLISTETVRRIACDATVAIAVDDDVGHTMYEGRARRLPSDAQRREVRRRDRHCRFPGCTNVTFTNAHHIKPWKPDGRTDLDNLALLCEYHHRRMHTKEWVMSGDANGELTFVGPTGRVMTSRPSPTWTAVTGRLQMSGGRQNT
jgi:Domain of unknown function (DUF222)/HNH endonuclease